MKKLAVLAITAMVGASVPGCANIGYYFQALEGHVQLMRRSQPIAALLADPKVSTELKAKLSRVREVREYASESLSLPHNGSYHQYADLNRPYVVWNVFATPELSMQTRNWCFLIAGCVSYRGFFSLERAQAFAAELRSRGDDVFVGGVPAYSTLGWFDDPVLSTFIHYPEAEIARLIFHELAHQVVYVADDSAFNESFATAVEQEGMRRWLADRGTEEQKAAFDLAQARKRDFLTLIDKYRGRLAALYASGVSEDRKRTEKARIFSELQADYQRLKSEWGGFNGYDRWFAQDISNAQIASVAVYTQWVPAFAALLEKARGDLPTFYEAVKQLARLPKEERIARLKELGGKKIELASQMSGEHR
jgi:predicted aminopeptidase